MKTEWDYSDLAKAYLKRPNYSDEAITRMLEITSIGTSANACDVGAGVAHLTIELAKRGLNVIAVEPNDSMRKYGKMRTQEMTNVSWVEGTGEKTGQNDSTFDIVTFGSSFNVTDRQQALEEAKRILKSQGWFAAMWNHRDLTDPIQQEIEDIIKRRIPEYGYGVRREDQVDVLNASGFFKEVHKIEGNIVHKQTLPDVVEAWRSHATLQRQAGNEFHSIITDIETMLKGMSQEEITIPYTTRIFLAQLNE